MRHRRLDVWCFGELAGTLEETDAGPLFFYAPDWASRRRPPLSQSLPLGTAPSVTATAVFFGGLLPEGRPRGVLARRLGVSPENDFSLLAALGGDTAGAISLLPPGELPAAGSASNDVTWLDDAGLAAEIEALPARPMHADEDGEYRLSLAGAQDKLPVVVGADGRVGLTRWRTPSTHIMKTPIATLDHTVANEAMCLDIGRRLGIDTVQATPRRACDQECLLVTRYDRERTPDHGRLRLHQEDVCQALGIPTQQKYQAEGGPTLTACFALLRAASAVPARDVLQLLDQIALSFLVGNNDAHGKNFSLLYRPDRTQLAPAYDVFSTSVYRGLSRKMAMSIGAEYRPEYVRARHLGALIESAGLGAAAARRRLASLAQAAPSHALAARSALVDGGWDAPVLARIVDMVAQRSRLLQELAGPVRR